jgi:hypothetical protein
VNRQVDPNNKEGAARKKSTMSDRDASSDHAASGADGADELSGIHAIENNSLHESSIGALDDIAAISNIVGETDSYGGLHPDLSQVNDSVEEFIRPPNIDASFDAPVAHVSFVGFNELDQLVNPDTSPSASSGARARRSSYTYQRKRSIQDSPGSGHTSPLSRQKSGSPGATMTTTTATLDGTLKANYAARRKKSLAVSKYEEVPKFSEGNPDENKVVFSVEFVDVPPNVAHSYLCRHRNEVRNDTQADV